MNKTVNHEESTPWGSKSTPVESKSTPRGVEIDHRDPLWGWLIAEIRQMSPYTVGQCKGTLPSFCYRLSDGFMLCMLCSVPQSSIALRPRHLEPLIRGGTADYMAIALSRFLDPPEGGGGVPPPPPRGGGKMGGPALGGAPPGGGKK
jgi:hypothetical protein